MFISNSELLIRFLKKKQLLSLNFWPQNLLTLNVKTSVKAVVRNIACVEFAHVFPTLTEMSGQVP